MKKTLTCLASAATLGESLETYLHTRQPVTRPLAYQLMQARAHDLET